MDLSRNRCTMAKRSACAAIILLLAATVVSVAQTKTSCLDCHSSLSDNLLISADQYAADVHVRKGLTCASCHGGDPSSDDPERAMSKGAGFRGHISHRDVPQLC